MKRFCSVGSSPNFRVTSLPSILSLAVTSSASVSPETRQVLLLGLLRGEAGVKRRQRLDQLVDLAIADRPLPRQRPDAVDLREVGDRLAVLRQFDVRQLAGREILVEKVAELARVGGGASSADECPSAQNEDGENDEDDRGAQVHSGFSRLSNPEGVTSQSPGSQQRPWVNRQSTGYPEGVASIAARRLCNPFGVTPHPFSPPRVREARPWASICNPFGVNAPSE